MNTYIIGDIKTRSEVKQKNAQIWRKLPVWLQLLRTE
jgi:hypothetical protein